MSAFQCRLECSTREVHSKYHCLLKSLSVAVSMALLTVQLISMLSKVQGNALRSIGCQQLYYFALFMPGK